MLPQCGAKGEANVFHDRYFTRPIGVKFIEKFADKFFRDVLPGPTAKLFNGVPKLLPINLSVAIRIASSEEERGFGHVRQECSAYPCLGLSLGGCLHGRSAADQMCCAENRPTGCVCGRCDLPKKRSTKGSREEGLEILRSDGYGYADRSFLCHSARMIIYTTYLDSPDTKYTICLGRRGGRQPSPRSGLLACNRF